MLQVRWLISGLERVMDSTVILDNDEEEKEQAQPCTSSSFFSANTGASKASLPAPTHITESPFASAQKESHILLLENQKLFKEFLEHCSAHTKEHPEVITFLQSKHTKASPDFLASVELRNTLGRCLTRAQAWSSKTFVYINELCTVLKQHAVKKRAPFTTVASSAGEGVAGEPKKEECPSPSIQEEHKKATKASRRQIAYLENLLKVYYEEIRRLQEKEISLDGMMEEDSSYIQEHRLKRKMMKIYNKLCELKGCSTLTGRVIEQKVLYSGTRYREINRKIERFINSPESQQNPPDYTDILQVVQRANERYSLLLSPKQVAQIAQEAFRETGNRLQERRHLDMVYNFGSHLTDAYKPAADPALTNLTLARKLRSNREVALVNLNNVITKYCLKQEDAEEIERKKRLEKGKLKEENAQQGEESATATENRPKSEEVEGCESEREEPESGGEGQDDSEDDDDEDDVSSDPDIEEELQASQLQEGGDDDVEELEEEEVTNESDKEEPWETGRSSSPNVEVISVNGEEDSQSASSCQGDTTEGRLSGFRRHLKFDATPPASPSQSEVTKLEQLVAGARGSSVSESCQGTESLAFSPLVSKVASVPTSPVLDSPSQHLLSSPCDSKTANGSPLPPSPVGTKTTLSRRKRKGRCESSPEVAFNGSCKRAYCESDDDIPLDMGVYSSSPLHADSTHLDSPFQELVSSSRCSPPPKRNKVDVATQCDPDEVIVLSDSD
ncbi:death domain-associated protein 6 [Arapaima gigas]